VAGRDADGSADGFVMRRRRCVRRSTLGTLHARANKTHEAAWRLPLTNQVTVSANQGLQVFHPDRAHYLGDKTCVSPSSSPRDRYDHRTSKGQMGILDAPSGTNASVPVRWLVFFWGRCAPGRQLGLSSSGSFIPLYYCINFEMFSRAISEIDHIVSGTMSW
jgi:hypothetical protein